MLGTGIDFNSILEDFKSCWFWYWSHFLIMSFRSFAKWMPKKSLILFGKLSFFLFERRCQSTMPKLVKVKYIFSEISSLDKFKNNNFFFIIYHLRNMKDSITKGRKYGNQFNLTEIRIVIYYSTMLNIYI